MAGFLQQPFPAALQHSQQSSKAWSGQLRREHALAVQNVASLCLRDLWSLTGWWDRRLGADLPLESPHYQKIHLLALPAAMGLRREPLPSLQVPAWLRWRVELAHLVVVLSLILQMHSLASEAVACHANLSWCPRGRPAQRLTGLVVAARSRYQ